MESGTVLRALWLSAGLPEAALGHLELTGQEPVLPSSFRIGTAAQTSIAASALAAAEVGHLRSGRRQGVKVEMRHAALEFRSERYFAVDGAPPGNVWDPIAGLYRCGDGGWVRLHTNFPHHRDGILSLLRCRHERAAVNQALQRWQAMAFEEAAAREGLCVTALRSFEEWHAHPQGQAVSALPLVSIDRIGDAPAQALPPGERPLSGVRVLDLTRVIAGPVCGRTLAAHGADVLLVTGPGLPSVPALVVDTGRGKLSAQLDLRTPNGRDHLAGLLQDADIFVQGYRPGALARHGFAPADTARIRPGIVHVSLSAYGQAGPWRERRGFDSLVQTASGFNAAEAAAAGRSEPLALPAQALDHASGYLLAFGALAALHRRAKEGGSWHVQVSLARTGHWIAGLGRVTDGFACPDPDRDDVQDLLENAPSGFGRLTAIRHAARMSDTPCRWDQPSVPLGTHEARWPAARH